MNTLIDRIEMELLNDDADRSRQSELLLQLYNNASKKEKELINEVFCCICGYSLETLINQPE